MSISLRSVLMLGALAGLAACSRPTPPVTPPVTPLTGAGIAATIPGHTWQTHQKSDGRLIVQRYSPGTDHGTFVGVYGSEANRGTWRIRNDQWCETWDGGGGCWDVLAISDTELQLVEDGLPLPIPFVLID